MKEGHNEYVTAVELQRPDGSEFEIQKSVFYSNYRVIEREEREEREEVKDEVGVGNN